MRVAGAILGCALAISAIAADGDNISLGDAAANAVQQSKLTLPNGKPFHLQAQIVETTNPSSEYQAKVEEYWISPQKWRRTIESPKFSQVLVVNGVEVWEKDEGDYYPWWLNDLVTAIADPLPMAEALKQVNAKVAKPQGSESSNTCADIQTKIDRWVFCFEGSHGLLTSALTRGYDAEFKEFKDFEGKRVARVVTIDPEPGTTIQATITGLSDLSQPDESLFAIEQPIPPDQRISAAMVDDATVRGLALTGTHIEWPTVGEGATKGSCAVFISADRAGRVREVWPAGCDNAGLQDPLREIVSKWQLKPADVRGVPVQVEALLTFTFETQMEASKALPELSDAEVRALATNIVEPTFPPGSVEKGSDVAVRISVDESGKLTGIDNPNNLKGPAFFAASGAVQRWSFHPYVKDGKSQYFHATVVFHAQ